jgi:hypothetical protein
MTRFADDLFDDLMREHGPTLAHLSVPAARQRHLATRPVLMTAGAGGVAVAAAVGTLVATGGGNPAYAVTTHPNGTVTLAVYQESGIAGANVRLHQLGDDRVVVVPIGAGCPSITTLPAPAVRASNLSMQANGSDGSVTLSVQGVPVGDILVVGVETANGSGQFSKTMQQTANGESDQGSASGSSFGHASSTGAGKGGPGKGGPGAGPSASTSHVKLTSGPAPSCVSIPSPPNPPDKGGTGGGAAGGPGGGQGTHESGGKSDGKSLSASS